MASFEASARLAALKEKVAAATIALKKEEVSEQDAAYWSEVLQEGVYEVSGERALSSLLATAKSLEAKGDTFDDFKTFKAAFNTLLMLQRNAIKAKPQGSKEREFAVKKLLSLLAGKKFLEQYGAELEKT